MHRFVFGTCVIMFTHAIGVAAVAHATPAVAPAPINYAKAVRHMAWSPDGKVLAIGVAGEATVELWSWPAGAAPTRLQRIAWRSPKTGGDAMAITFAPDGQTLAVGFSGGLLELFSTAGTHLRTLHSERSDQVRAIAFLPDGNSLLWASGDGRTRQVDVASGKLLRELTQLPGPVRAYAVAVSPDGRFAVTVGMSATALLHDLKAGTAVVLPPVNASTHELRFTSFSPDGKTVFASGANAGLVGWKLTDRVARYVGSCTWYDIVAGAPIACGSGDELAFIDVETERGAGAPLPDLPIDLSTLVYTKDGKRVILADDDGGVRVFDTVARTLDGAPLTP